MTSEGRRAVALLTVPALLLAVVCAIVLIVDRNPVPTNAAGTTSSMPSLGQALGDGLFGESLQLGFRPTRGGGVVTIPPCIGRVTRLGVVSADLHHTVWAIEAADPAGVQVDDIRLGLVPDGFRELDPLNRPQLDELVLVLVDATKGRGAARLELDGDALASDSCS